MAIERVADLVKMAPSITDVETDPPRPGMSRLRCFFFFKYGGPDESCYARSRGWWMKNLQGLCYDMDKEYSRTTSRLAIPQLMNEINFLRDPQQAEERFKRMAFGSGVSCAPVEKPFLTFRQFTTLIAYFIAVIATIFGYKLL